MLLSIEYRGQLALAAASAKVRRDVEPGTLVSDLLKALAADEGDDFRRLVLDENGECGSTLFVAVDGEHVRTDAGATLPENAREMVVMPPIAGG
ncbi:MAG: MoaD/ThiS family protein [Verrucomicrobiales bacterium]|nr:MoaD/ThiS family protein [Verrucomicrobiae bacterium]